MQMWFLTNHFPKKNESVQYNTALAITGAIKGSSREKLYEELAQEYLYRSRWTRRLCLLYKVFSSGQPSYIYDLLPPLRSSRRHVNSFNLVTCKSEYFKNSLIPNSIYEWNKLDPDILSSASYNLFRNTLLKFIRPAQRKTFNINDSVGVKLLTRLRLGFSHLRGHKFRHGFRMSEKKLIDLILYGNDKLDDNKNRNILMWTIKFIKGSQRFDEKLL